jgi:hypothetical protein
MGDMWNPNGVYDPNNPWMQQRRAGLEEQQNQLSLQGLREQLQGQDLANQHAQNELEYESPSNQENVANTMQQQSLSNRLRTTNDLRQSQFSMISKYFPALMGLFNLKTQ